MKMRFSTTICLSLVLFLVILGLAGSISVQAQGFIEIPNPLEHDTTEEIIAAITDLLRLIALGIAPIMIIWGGIMIMAAGGSEEKVTKGKKTLMWTVIGLAIVLAFDFIVDLIAEIL